MTSALLSRVGGAEGFSGEKLAPMPLSPGEVGARIARARQEMTPKPWSQLDLALALGVSPSSAYRWEKGKLPSMTELMRVAEVLGKPPDYLTEPPERQVELADLRQELEAIRLPLEELVSGADRTREAVGESLASIDVRLSRIEQLLSAQDELGHAHP